MLSDTEKERLELYVMQQLQDEYDLFDFKANIDSTLTYDENKNIIMDKIESLKKQSEPTTKEVQEIELRKQEFINKRNTKNDLINLFDKPKIIGIIADTNQGKSNLIYYIITELKKRYEFNLYSYGLRVSLGEQKIHSVEELEKIRNSIIFCDEYFTLFNIEDRKQRTAIEKTLRLLHHNNNILVLSGLPDNYKKYISSNLDAIIYKRCTLSNFINGSTAKNVAITYKGHELGSSILDLEIEKCLIYDGTHYQTLTTPYMEAYDTKKNNSEIIRAKSVQTIVQNVVKK